MQQSPLEHAQSKVSDNTSMAPFPLSSARSIRRNRARRAHIGWFFGIVGGLYFLAGIGGMGWLISRFLPFFSGHLSPKMTLLFLFLPPAVLWFVISGLFLFQGKRWALRAALYTLFGAVAFNVVLLYLIPSQFVQIPAVFVLFFDLILLCLLVDERFKRNFERIHRQQHRRHRRKQDLTTVQ